MILSLRHRKSAAWVSAVAGVTSLLLVLGQVFHCCRINEAVAALVSHTLEHLEGSAHGEGAEGHPPLVSHHAACHGAAPTEGEAAHPPIQPDEACLSEADLTLKGVEPGPYGSLKLFPAAAKVPAWPVTRPAPALPQPPDAAGLPPYLLTLRLLV